MNIFNHNGTWVVIEDGRAQEEVGDGSGSPATTYQKADAGTSTITFQKGVSVADGDKRLQHDASEYFNIDHYNGSTWGTAVQIRAASDIRVPVDSPTLKVGTGGGSPTLQVNKEDAGTGTVLFVGDSGSLAQHDWRLQQNAAESLVVARYDGSGWVDSVTFDTGSNIDFGDYSLNPVFRYRKTSGGVSYVHFRTDPGDASPENTNDKRFVHSNDETFIIQHYDGSGWVDCIKIDNNGHVILPSDTDAARGAAGTAGRVIFNTDDGQLNVDDGTNWTLPDGTTT
jgi:hypothetical protein